MTHEMTAFEAGYQAFWDGEDRITAMWRIANEKTVLNPASEYDNIYYREFHRLQREAVAGWLEADKNCALTEWST